MSHPNIYWHEGKVSCEERYGLLGQRGTVIWLTGLSGAGKSTIAVELEKELLKLKKVVFVLDGDNVRHGLNADLSFSVKDRNENIRRISEVAALFKEAGVIVLVSVISPFREMREYAKNRAGKDNFIEVYIKADLTVCEKRDPKGLYKKARKGEISDFTGISSPYEEPLNPDITVDTGILEVQQSVEIIKNYILEKCIPI